MRQYIRAYLLTLEIINIHLHESICLLFIIRNNHQYFMSEFAHLLRSFKLILIDFKIITLVCLRRQFTCFLIKSCQLVFKDFCYVQRSEYFKKSRQVVIQSYSQSQIIILVYVLLNEEKECILVLETDFLVVGIQRPDEFTEILDEVDQQLVIELE